MKRFGLIGLCVLLCASALLAKKLDTLAITGLSIYQPSVVKNSIGFKTGDEFTALDVQNGIKNLYRLGLFKTIDFYVENETDSSVGLRVAVEEYPIVESYEFSGNKNLKKEELEEKLTVKKGTTLTDALVADNVQIIRKFYSEKGYLLADVSATKKPSQIPGNVLLTISVKEGSKVKIKKITFKGNLAFKENKIKDEFKTKEDAWWRSSEFDREGNQRNLDTLIMFYNDQGYLDAAVERDTFWIADNKKDLYIDVTINEGRKYFAGNFFFSGNKILDNEILSSQIALKSGKPFEKTKFEQTKYLLGNAYREEGYLWSSLKDVRSFRGDTIDITFEIVEGTAAVVRKIDITGNSKTRDKVIRRELMLLPGQKYKQSLMARSVRELTQLDYFANVAPNITKQNEDGSIDLVFDVAEKETMGQLSLGATFSEAYKFGGTFTTSIPNFRGLGEKLDVSINIGQTQNQVSLGFSEPWAFDSPLFISSNVSYQRIDYGEGKSYETKGISFGAGRKLKWPDDFFSLSGQYQLQYQVDWDSDNANGIAVIPEGLLSKLSLTLRRNDTDFPNFPNQGSDFMITPSIAGIGGDYSFLKTTVAYNWYFPLMWKLVLGLKTNIGFLSGLDPNQPEKVSSRDLFSAGGILSRNYDFGVIRGFRDGSFGGTPASGATMLTFSTELRYPLVDQTLYMALFNDLGNVWGKVGDIDPANLREGFGVGMRLKMDPIGLIGVDFGWGLRSDTHFGSPAFDYNYHINIGRGF